MGDLVKIVECPRDAWQGMLGNIPSEIKANYLRKLIAAGFIHIDAASFVSPAAVPQMADSEKVLALLGVRDGVEIIGIVANARGAERAIRTGLVKTLGFPYSISAEFLKRNQGQTIEQALETLRAIGSLAHKAGLEVVAYVSMAFGNPYGELWSIDQVVGACDLLFGLGVRQISLADTVGLAIPAQILEVVSEVMTTYSAVEFGVHLHACADDATAGIKAAYEAGCRRFDAAIGGLGGCPFAQDALVGNIPTEVLIATLKGVGAQLPELRPLDELMQASAQINRNYGAGAHSI